MFGEFELIQAIRQHLQIRNQDILLGIGDDAAIVKSFLKKDLIFTTDMLIEKVHFCMDWITPKQLGVKSMAVNISDCAAMGAHPVAATISLGIPVGCSKAMILDFYSGIEEIGKKFSVSVVGGDTVKSPCWVINIALIGWVEQEKALQRSRAQVGDAVFVTGTLGDSSAGLKLLEENFKKTFNQQEQFLIQRHLSPSPRCEVGRYLAQYKLAHSAIDISDGLSSEIHHICQESGVGAEIHESALPTSTELQQFCNQHFYKITDLVFHGGEDYELLFTVSPQQISKVLNELVPQTGIACKSIGRILPKSQGVSWIDMKGHRSPLKALGFDHFQANE
jgi:thiamine-monophosphate kinase